MNRRALALTALATLTGCINPRGLIDPFTPLIRPPPPTSAFDAPGGQSWPEELGLLPPAFMPATLKARPAEADAPLVMLSFQMVITHAYSPGAYVGDRIIPPTERTHIDLTRTLWIRTAAAARHARAFEIIPGCARSVPITVRTINPDGAMHTSSYAHAVPLSVNPHAGSPIAYTLNFPHPEPGSVITFRYRITCDGILPFDRFDLREDMPIREVEYTLKSYADAEIATRHHGMTLQTSYNRHARKTWRFTATDLPAQPPEPGLAREPGVAPEPDGRVWASYVLHRADRVPYLEDWTPMLRSIDQMSRPLTAEVHRALGRPPRPVTDPIDAAWDLIHRDLLDARLPDPPRKPTFTDFHRRRRSGSFGRALSLRALLTAWKIPCDLVFTTPTGTSPIERDYPFSPRAASLLVRCGDRTLDPAVPGGAPGDIHPAHRGRPAIVLAHIRNQLDPLFITLPTAHDPRPERALTLTLDPAGLRIDATATLHGHPAATLRHQLRDRRPTTPRDTLLRAAITPTLTEGQPTPPDLDPRAPLTLALTAARTDADALARTPNHALITPAALLPTPVYALLELPDRHRPITLDRPDGYTHRITLALPPGATLARAPEPATLTTPFGTWTRAITPGDATLTLTETLELTPATIPPAKWPALRDFLTAADTARREPIVLTGLPSP